MSNNHKRQDDMLMNKRFPIQWGKDFADEIRLTLLEDIIINAYNKTRDELKGYLTMDEAVLIINALNSSLYTSRLSDKKVLSTEVLSYSHMNNMNAEELLQKLDSLTEFQAFTVIRMAIEFWEEESNEDNLDIITRIFSITDSDIRN